ncbi:hypothetical protein KSP40_PGU000277 [Platanthera guangdongensis]|uniref:Uncharacterized protein n=1 Tax=Platanthera guangdongensis TaxID=2320717 RepID=A0ABR2MEK1_9ASPA
MVVTDETKVVDNAHDGSEQSFSELVVADLPEPSTCIILRPTLHDSKHFAYLYISKSASTTVI